ncbi:hypothetical protein IT402_01330 [Candidatus Nomurabacteria bacterium]|nr:hypothetical protein [Candidatus Nomurabacteria bacterium]
MSEAIIVEVIGFLVFLFTLLVIKKGNVRRSWHLVALVTLVVLPSIWFGVTWIIKEIKNFDISKNALPWFLIPLVIILIIIVFFRITKLKVENSGFKLRWLWWIPALVGLFFLGRWFYVDYILKPEILKDYSKTSTIYPRFDVNGENCVNSNTWYKLEDSEPLMSFISKDGNPLNYQIVMLGHESRNWTRKTSSKSTGEVSDEPTSKLQPYDEAKIGLARIKFDRNTVVVVFKK